METQERRYRIRADALEVGGMLNEWQRSILHHAIGLAVTGQEGVGADELEGKLRWLGNAAHSVSEKIETGSVLAKVLAPMAPKNLGKRLSQFSVPEFSVFPKKLPVGFSLDHPLTIFVTRPDVCNPGGRAQETLHLEKNGKMYSVRTAPAGRHFAEADPVGKSVSARLIVGIPGSSNEPLFEKGVCWVESGNPARVVFNLENIEKYLKPGEISSRLREMSERVEQKLQDIFRNSKKSRVA